MAATIRWRSRIAVAHPLAAQVDVAVAKPRLLPDLAAEALDAERRRLGVSKQLGSCDADLELPGGEVRVHGLRIAADRGARGTQDVLGAKPVGKLDPILADLVRMEDELDQPRAVAQVDEHDPAVVAAAMHPAGDADLAANPVLEHLTGPRVAVAVLR